MHIPHAPGCYIINHIPSGRFYVGSAIDISSRYFVHMSNLRQGVHKNKYLQQLFDEDNNFEIEWVVTNDREEAFEIEQSELDRYIGHRDCLNVLNDAKRSWKVGTMPSELRRATASRNKTTHAGQTYRLGMTHTDETKLKMSVAQRSRDPSTFRRGYTVSEETRAKMVEANSRPRLGARKPKSDETRLRMKAASVERSLKLSKPVCICGIVYSSAGTAAMELGYSRRTVIVRISDERFPEWNYVSHGEVNSISVL